MSERVRAAQVAFIACVLAAACRAPPHADPGDLPLSVTIDERPAAPAMVALATLLPPALDILGAVDLASLRKKGAFAALAGVEDRAVPPALQRARAALGLDPFQDVDEVAFGVKEQAEPELVAVIRCRYRREEVQAAAQKSGFHLSAQSAAGDAGEVWTAPDGTALALLTSDTLVYGNAAFVKRTRARAMENRPVEASSLAGLWRVACSNGPDISLAMRIAPALRARLAASGEPTDLESLLGALAVDPDGGVRAAVALAAPTPERAEAVAVELRHALAAAGHAPLLVDLGLAESVLLAPVTTRGRQIRIEYRLSARSLRSVVDRARRALAATGAAGG